MPPPDILCLGALHRDLIGRVEAPAPPGADLPGRVVSRPGGVAMNVAAALAREGLRPALLSHVGPGPEGDALIAEAARSGADIRFLARLPGLPVDRYLAVEGPEGLVAAVADAAGLEAAGEAILAPLRDGRLADAGRPWAAAVVLDGNLSAALLEALAAGADLAAATLRLVPASPEKAPRLAPFRARRRATLHVNLAEAGRLLGGAPAEAGEAAAGLVAAGWSRVLVTDGPRPAAFVAAGLLIRAAPPAVTARRVTGAGDACLAAHIAAEARGLGPEVALRAALDAAARHVSLPFAEAP